MLDIWTVSIFVIAFTLVWIYRTGRRPSGLIPPGPPTWPVIGNLDLYYKDPMHHMMYQKLGREYNGLFSFQHGKFPGVVITNYNIAKEAFIEKADIFSNRPTHHHFDTTLEERGIAISNGDQSTRLRRVTKTAFRDFGVGKVAFEQRIQEQIDELIVHLYKTEGKQVQLHDLFSMAVGNVMYGIVFGKKYPFGDPKFTRTLEVFDSVIKDSVKDVFQFLPLWTYIFIPLFEPKLLKIPFNVKSMKDILSQAIKDREKDFNHKCLRDFTDLCVNATISEEIDNSYTAKQMFNSLYELFIGGYETTKSALLWGIICFVKYPEVQKKCRKEIIEKIGDRPLTYKDRKLMPYYDATNCEIFRRCNPVPLPFSHESNQASTLAGYTIPAKTIVTYNTYAIHMDPTLWDNPEEFQPERFLDKEGNVVKPGAFVPFGMGRRYCIGDQLAKTEIWMVLADLLRRFEFMTDDPSRLATPETTDRGVSLYPERFYVKATRIN